MSTVRLLNGESADITEKIGEGGQGSVYKIRLRGSGELKAFKVFNVETLEAGGEDLLWRIQGNIEFERKHRLFAPVFLWPEEIGEIAESGLWGYTMPLAEARFIELGKFLSGRAEFKDCKALASAALNIYDSFRRLHVNGFVYMDINDANIAADPDNGDIIILDTDNITGNDQVCVASPVFFMAPEIVRGDIEIPDKYTDLYAMAVIFFYMFYYGHPLEGSRLPEFFTEEAMAEHYGRDPVYIWDADDKRNLPSKRLNSAPVKRRKGFPDFIRLAFGRCFSHESLTDVVKRQRLRLENNWLHILMRLKSSAALCPRCGQSVFVDYESRYTQCLHCLNQIPDAELYLDFGVRGGEKVGVPAYPGAALYAYHMRRSSGDYQHEAGEIVGVGGGLRLINRSGLVWQAVVGGRLYEVKPGDGVELKDCERIDFGAENICRICRS